jgi:hypothetical protein
MLVSNYPNVSINTANPSTEMARRDAVRRDLFEPVKEAEKSSAEKPVVTDEKARVPGNNTSSVSLYDATGKETETQQAVEGRGERQPDQQNSDEQTDGKSEQQAEQQEKQEQQEIQQEVQQLKSRDQEVKTHEQAHAAIGGRYAGAPSYSYELGPDGKQYAVAGEVQIDISPVAGDPQATVQKMQQVRAAALAPAEPSSADRRIAANAAQQQIQAQAELVKQTSAAANTPRTDPADQKRGFSDTQTQTDVSYSVSETDGSSAIIFPQRDTLAITAQMQVRRSVIAGFYQRSTEPQFKQSLQQA